MTGRELSSVEKEDVAEILRRRANEVAIFHMAYTRDKEHQGSVELALSREIQRLRDLAEALHPESESS